MHLVDRLQTQTSKIFETSLYCLSLFGCLDAQSGVLGGVPLTSWERRQRWGLVWISGPPVTKQPWWKGAEAKHQILRK